MNSEKDDFWSVEKLVPKKSNAPHSRFSEAAIMADVVISGAEPESSRERALNYEGFASDGGTFSYVPASPFIKNVTVKRSIDKYDFYGSFRKAALIYYDMKAPRCDFVSFFSYMPQYSQLSAAQRSYYLYWREEIRRGKFLQTDYSYLYLLVYEILNLPDKIPPESGVALLVSLWRAYHKQLPHINERFSRWLQDYCLIYQLACPTHEMRELLFDAMLSSELKEFYLSELDNITEESTEALLAYLSYYDWRSGKYAGGESREKYRAELLGAMRLLLSSLFEHNTLISRKIEPSRIVRQAFKGSLCTHRVKAFLEIEYYPLSHDEQLRANVTEALRYTENKLRALLGIKSRLLVRALPETYKAIIDSYFSTVAEAQKKNERVKSLPEYEKLYDGEVGELSFAAAEKIESASWKSSLRLVNEEELAEAYSEAVAPKNDEGSAKSSETGESLEKASPLCATEVQEEVEFLRALVAGDASAMRAACKAASALPEELSERINARFAEHLGDVVIELSDGAPELIDDYRNEVCEWIRKVTI